VAAVGGPAGVVGIDPVAPADGGAEGGDAYAARRALDAGVFDADRGCLAAAVKLAVLHEAILKFIQCGSVMRIQCFSGFN
jgi:hypothetical protein